MKLKVETKNAEETMNVGAKLAKSIGLPVVVSLVGDLGAGKTTFTKGFAQGFGVSEVVTSPTFTIMNEYDGRAKLYHFDMYRLGSFEEAVELGFEEYFDLTKLKGACLVEWAENVEGLLPARHLEVTILKGEGDKRVIEIEPRGLV